MEGAKRRETELCLNCPRRGVVRQMVDLVGTASVGRSLGRRHPAQGITQAAQ